ncbi:hypothetical protein GJV52_12765 [Neisseria brasiliensis]|uniref:hypothetical protein n=1 Tax=Neisseria TaxID=482 RepID=UPI000C276435|nr:MULTISPECIES: hypothetical protein [Neisseria]PJO79125.1 hypothetical protein CWC45_01420 [Neisseria sp. N177_16]QGL26323.1 hypothetical protein GJV52_12765 [Neisseria brasiliensis]
MFKKFLKLVFPFRKPVSKRIFDLWLKILEDTAVASIIAIGPYLWIDGGSVWNRCLNVLILLLISYTAQLLVHYLVLYESKLTMPQTDNPDQSDERKKP